MADFDFVKDRQSQLDDIALSRGLRNWGQMAMDKKYQIDKGNIDRANRARNDQFWGDVGGYLNAEQKTYDDEINAALAELPRFEPIRFPLDLCRNTGDTFVEGEWPFVNFQFIDFRDRWGINENVMSSSDIENKDAAQNTILGSIALPMPQEFQSGIAPQWEMEDSKTIALGMELYSNKGYADSIMSKLQAITAPDISKKIQWKTANPKKQAFFNGIDPREFSFTYTFSPQSRREAEVLQLIVETFNFYSLPGLTEGDAFFSFPAEFFISFHGVAGFPVISPCVCTSVAHNLTPAGMQLLSSGHPVQTGISLTFKETTLRTRGMPGYQSGRIG